MRNRVTAKLANMRKPQEFSVMRDQNGIYIVQSDKSTGRFDGKGRGWLNTKGTTFAHLTFYLGARAYDFPAEFVQECQEIYARAGERMGQLGRSPVIFGGVTTVGAPEDRIEALISHYRTYCQFKNAVSEKPLSKEEFEVHFVELEKAEREELLPDESELL